MCKHELEDKKCIIQGKYKYLPIKLCDMNDVSLSVGYIECVAIIACFIRCVKVEHQTDI